MPAGDAGLEREADKYNERGECLTCGSSAPCEHDDTGTGFVALAYVDSLKAAEQERDKLREQLAAQQAVVEAARDYRQSVIDMMHVMETGGDAWRMARERRVSAETRMFSGLAALDAAQPEGEQAH
jgi:hypothetical protein